MNIWIFVTGQFWYLKRFRNFFFLRCCGYLFQNFNTTKTLGKHKFIYLWWQQSSPWAWDCRFQLRGRSGQARIQGGWAHPAPFEKKTMSSGQVRPPLSKKTGSAPAAAISHVGSRDYNFGGTMNYTIFNARNR